MSEWLILIGIGLAAVSGVPGLFLSRFANAGQQIATVLATLATSLGLLGVAVFWSSGESQPIAFDWQLPGAEFRVALDGLSAVFLVPIFLIALLGSVYGLDYWRQTDHPHNGCKLRIFFGVLTAGMALLVVAGNSILFLFGWEIMALAAFFLVTTEDHDPEVRATGWIYFVATHVATLCLFAMFMLLRKASGAFTLQPLAQSQLSGGMATAIFVLALIGFGLKAGVMPLHIWLPSAHAIAPSHVSAIMSGVIIKMGIYGLVRVLSLLPAAPIEWGFVLLLLGVVSGVLGVAFAIGQHDIKRLLAYHSIENIGIIVMGVGLAMIGRSVARWDWVVLALGGALLHVWNHALFKALLFLSAGSVTHATHTRAIDQLGGLSKRMPHTAFCFLVGAVAICGLPPLNGFVSEFLIYLGLFRSVLAPGAATDGASGANWIGVGLAAPALALIGGLALACFVKVFGAVFLGTARTEPAGNANESPATMTVPMLVLVACCAIIGLAPALPATVFDQAIAAWAPGLRPTLPPLGVQAPLAWISILAVSLLVGLAAVGGFMWMRLSRSVVEAGATWACGYAAPTPRMQYTSSSFGTTLVYLFDWALRPRAKRPAKMALFPTPSSFHSEVPETVLEEAVLPSFRFAAWALSWFRVVQQGSVQTYLLYVFIALIVLLLWR